MSAVDPVAAYEGGVQACHGAPQRDCCVRVGLAAVLRHAATDLAEHGPAPGLPLASAMYIHRRADQLAAAPTPGTDTLRTPEEWLTQPEFAGTEILDHDGWRDRPWTDPITHDEFRRRLYQCTITAPVPVVAGWGAMVRHGAAVSEAGQPQADTTTHPSCPDPAETTQPPATPPSHAADHPHTQPTTRS